MVGGRIRLCRGLAVTSAVNYIAVIARSWTSSLPPFSARGLKRFKEILCRSAIPRANIECDGQVFYKLLKATVDSLIPARAAKCLLGVHQTVVA